jgi:predicted heme/steroid binding protein
MDARGYPEGDFEQRFADVSVDHPTTLGQYRTAHEIGLRHAEGHASTEDLRQAMVNDHALFTELLVDQPAVETVSGTAVPAAVPV